MGNKSKVFEQTIKQSGYWSYKDLYTFCFNWLKDAGYGVKENEYTEKNSADGKEILLDWSAGKSVTDYFKNEITAKWHILRMKDAEIERDGRMVGTNKGDLKIVITATLESDYDDKWKGTAFLDLIRGIYEKYIMKTTTEQYEDRVKDDAKEFVSQIKSFLQL